jgi:hypothetical protein
MIIDTRPPATSETEIDVFALLQQAAGQIGETAGP